MIFIGAKPERKNKPPILPVKITEIIELSKHRKGPKKVKDTVITVEYGAVSCTCAQWVIFSKQDREYIYLERVDKRLIEADHIWDGKHLPLNLKLTGSFYKNKGIPSRYREVKGSPYPAKIFKYRKIEILTSYFKNKKHWGINTN
jgi:hypothetical protein